MAKRVIWSRNADRIFIKILEFYIERKLFLHNMAHGMCAYLGYQKEYIYIWQAVTDSEIHKKVRSSMMGVAKSLNKKYKIPLEELVAHVDDLLERFANRLLGDTIVRVGRDPVRKLRNDDRFVGAALLCAEQGFNAQPIVDGIVSSLYFDNPEDTFACDLQKDIQKQGIEYILSKYMQLNNTSPIYNMILDTYNRSRF